MIFEPLHIAGAFIIEPERLEGRGVRWNDPAFGTVWSEAERTILEGDQNYPDFADEQMGYQ